ncbi:MAG: tetratricopeptide repeat protein [Desulforhopalus sp.]
MIKKITSTYKVTLILVSMFTGFIVGVVFTVYQSPSIVSQLAGNEQQGPSQEEIARHLKHLEKMINEDPNNVDAWTQLAYTYFDLQEFTKAIEAYERLVILADDKSIVYQDLGVAYRRTEQFEKAIESFQKAVELNPGNIEALFNIGVVQYHDLDDEAAATATWEKVAAVKPDFPLSTGQTIQQMLDKLK